MSTTTSTQILFNSPALHSLKRDQLVKLCKTHSIKASGKNIELIERLKKHADTLPKDSSLSVAVREEDATDEFTKHRNRLEEMNETGGEDASTRRSESTYVQMPRPSEQWEVVMESIEEMMEEGPSKGTFASLKTAGSMGSSGEFGTAMSKSSSITSSIKTLASSFGLKRGNSSTTLVSCLSSKSSLSSSTKGDELSKHSMPYASLATTELPPQTDHFTFHHPVQNPNERLESQAPLPGHTLRPGVPAPTNARLSLGLNPPSTPTRIDQPTTTIRLISKPINGATYEGTPMLRPFKTSFDLVLGSPQAVGGFRGTSLWPNDGKEGAGIYPPLPLDDLMSPSTAAASQQNGLVHSPFLQTPPDRACVLEAAPEPVMESSAAELPNPWPRPLPEPPAITGRPLPEPFIFGSPLPQHNVNNDQFKTAASSVLDEMNRRLDAQGVDVVGMDLIAKLQPGAHALGVSDVAMSKPETQKTVDEFYKEKFERLHEAEFNKMEGIDGLVRRKGGISPRKDSGASLANKRKSSVTGHGAGRDRYGRRISGHVGRVSTTRVISGGRRPRVLPGGFDDDPDSDSEVDDDEMTRSGGDKTVCEVKQGQDEEAKAIEEQDRKEREKEAIRRKLELNKARRRSSAAARGRVSVGRGGVLLKPEPQPKPSRFGFLSTAKSLVQNVWNRGKSKPSATSAASVPSSSGIPKLASKSEKNLIPPAVPSTKASSTGTNSTASGSTKVSSLRADKVKDQPKGSVFPTPSVRARSPLPSFVPPPTSRSSFRPSRTSSIAGTGTSAKSATGSQGGASSIGTRASHLSATSKPSSLGTVTSLGGKTFSTGRMSSTAIAVGSSSSSRQSLRLSSSRLLAPTASSLAKAARPANSGLNSTRTSGADTLKRITDGSKAAVMSPRPEKIFSRPLDLMPPSGIPTPKKPRATSGTSQLSSAGNSVQTGTQSKDTGSDGLAKQRVLQGRKPRISRSKVIAKLASQRAAGIPSASRDISNARRISGKAKGTPGRKRSSLGVKAHRSSYASGMIKGSGGTDAVLLSAKKRARQSEYHARRNRVQPIDLGRGRKEDSMDVDKY